jgi:ATP/ADP translocase
VSRPLRFPRRRLWLLIVLPVAVVFALPVFLVIPIWLVRFGVNIDSPEKVFRGILWGFATVLALLGILSLRRGQARS